MKQKEKREGWEWRETKSGGYWSRKTGPEHGHKLPLFCPHPECRRPTGTVDDKYMAEYGVCYLCYTNFIDGRKTPLIDIEEYKSKF